ncbi:hypothetical protein ABW636_16450 [Aquimarina sp. 2201CG1-2-11]|uniref:hypothetical protein n=1 Tax=Aquimarina discodermiae TaxID=3231043 RepID=UPI0034633C62
MRKWIITGIGVLGILSLTAFTTTPYSLPTVNKLQSDEITAVINKNTTEKDLEDLKTFFSENGIELRIKKVSFNDQNEITSLSLVLIKEGSKSQYSSSSNTPISEIKLGYKSGNLFITNSKTYDISSLKSLSNFNHPTINMDSLMKKHNFAFDFNFDEENDSLFFKGNFDMQKLKDQIMQSFTFSNDENGNFSFNGHVPQFQHHKSQKYSFIDNPDIEKLIIIDGKEADFNTLDSLSKSDQLEEVDILKPQIAISIYGEKAKDGAIIAITKK